MNRRDLTEKKSARSYRWVRMWLGLSILLALLLLGNSVRDYFFVARILSIQQVRHQVMQHIGTFERDLRANWTPGEPRLKLLTDEMASGSQQPVWVVLRDADGRVLEQTGTREHEVFTPEQETRHFRSREPLFDIIPSSHGEVVVEVFPVHAGGERPAEEGRGELARPLPISAEVAVPLSAPDPATLWPIRRNLMINVASALALLLTAGLTFWGFGSYVRGKQLEQQLEIARQVQANLLPRSTQLGGGVQVAVEYQPADEVAGDFYDTFHTERGPALVIGDVSGKGIPAALLMGVIHGAVRSSRWAESPASHQHETSELNRLLCERASGEQFASMFWSYCDGTNSTRVHYVNAGHCTPMLMGVRQGKVELKRLDVGGPVLGLLPEAAYMQGQVEIRPGDVMLLYSDGLVEATNAAGEEFGESRLEAVLSQSLQESTERIRDSILASVRAFLGDEPAHDDLTCVVAKFGTPQS